MSTAPRRIDVHYHIIPKRYVEALRENGIQGATSVGFPAWTPERALKHMNRSAVATAITSLSTPGVWFGDAALARKLSRICNEFQAQMVADYPGRFGSFAFLPLPDVEGSLLELDYALDQLGHDGVVLLSDVGGHYLGDPSYEELFAELDRHRAVVFIHPQFGSSAGHERYKLFQPLLEALIHTTRAATDLLYSGRLTRYPNIRFVLAHGGGAVPFLAHRIVDGVERKTARAVGDKGLNNRCPEKRADSLQLLRRLYYDTSSPGDAHLAALQEFVGASQIVYGTDGGWTPQAQVAIANKIFMAYDGFDESQLLAIERENAAGLFPRVEKTRKRLSTRAA
jgi:predicted TIM-barrel fold metal-dependent hydrolase